MKEKLKIEYSDQDFLLYGIVSDVKEFKLAWQLSNTLLINLVMQDEAVLDFTRGKQLNVVFYESQEENYTIRLIKNLAVEYVGFKNPNLLPELKKFNYLLMVEGEDAHCFDEELYFEVLKNASFVQYTSSINIDELKSLDNLMF